MLLEGYRDLLRQEVLLWDREVENVTCCSEQVLLGALCGCVRALLVRSSLTLQQQRFYHKAVQIIFSY